MGTSSFENDFMQHSSSLNLKVCEERLDFGSLGLAAAGWVCSEMKRLQFEAWYMQYAMHGRAQTMHVYARAGRME